LTFSVEPGGVNGKLLHTAHCSAVAFE
jgi:hypothetical protein